MIQDLLGGELIVADVRVDGVKVGHHWWNQLPDGAEIDLTAGQFHPGETVTSGEVRLRPPDAPDVAAASTSFFGTRYSARWPTSSLGLPTTCRGTGPDRRFGLLSSRWCTRPARCYSSSATRLRRPSPVNGHYWGHIEADETPAEAAVRELAEETGLVAELRPLWRDLRPDLTGTAAAVEPHVFAGTAAHTRIVLGEGQTARFVPMAELPRVDLSPTAAAVLHRAFGKSLVRPSKSDGPGSQLSPR